MKGRDGCTWLEVITYLTIYCLCCCCIQETELQPALRYAMIQDFCSIWLVQLGVFSTSDRLRPCSTSVACGCWQAIYRPHGATLARCLRCRSCIWTITCCRATYQPPGAARAPSPSSKHCKLGGMGAYTALWAAQPSQHSCAASNSSRGFAIAGTWAQMLFQVNGPLAKQYVMCKYLPLRRRFLLYCNWPPHAAAGILPPSWGSPSAFPALTDLCVHST